MVENDRHLEDAGTTGDPYLLALIGNLQVTTFVHLGKIADPARGEPARNLAAARASIDTLQMLRRKMQGNLSEGESRLLDHVIFELQMNYVDEASKPEAEPAASSEAPETSAEEAPRERE